MVLVRLSWAILCLGSLSILCVKTIDGSGAAQAASGAAARSSATVPSQSRSFEELMHEGRTLLEKSEPEEALKAFRQANTLQSGVSPDCLLGEAGAYLQLRQYKEMIASCNAVLAMAGAERSHVALAHGLKGVALMKLPGGTSGSHLAEAEGELRQSLEERPSDDISYTLGVLLLKMNRDAEGIEQLENYLDRESSGPVAERARRLIEDPRRARGARGGLSAPNGPSAHPFAMTLSDGTSLSLDELKGKVVLLDFWATWCGPCRSALPLVRSLAERLAGEPFTVVAVSADSDEEAWRRFLDQGKESWPQYLDTDGKMRQAYGVTAYPTYIVIDPEGIIRARITGWRPDVAREVDKALEIQKSAAH